MNKYSGSNFRDFLDEEGVLEEVSERAQKRLLVLQIQDIMDDPLNMQDLPDGVPVPAQDMKTSNHYLFDLDDTSITLECRNRLASMMRELNHYLLGPENDSITVGWLNRFAGVVG